MPEPEHQMWVRTAPTLDARSFVVDIDFTPDNSVTLTERGAVEYARAVLTTVARAEYDAAVGRQLTERGLDLQHVAQFVEDLRKDRARLDWGCAGDVVLTPCVNLSWEPFITMSVAGEPLGQITVTAARRQALHVLEAIAVAHLDQGYLVALRSAVHLDETTARAVVADLANHRQEAHHG